ncbi:hypothetical protein UFOVP1287_46 [uncultured Caudovirales phage]|uniref:Major capsid protein n=1 Tax=uncultured Caudovirales phage TaxID=2100421 RepID=A0A6J5RP47_9CAUD|nr:hypothetical protein UFOVP1287_46 [uncultured Caudovirales phage]CAB4205329.1 hypothetical protein UFOVP1408_67 [uncultured Caudovirales phage]
MAATNFGVGNELAVNLWSKKLSYEALQATKLSNFVGKTADSMIVVKDETNRQSGAKVTFGLRMQLKGQGVRGEEQLEGNEEKLVFRNDSLSIDQLRNAVLNVGAVSQQRVPFDLREEAKSGLVDWWADRIDASMMNQLAGNTNYSSDLRYTGMNSPQAPTNWFVPQPTTGTAVVVSSGVLATVEGLLSSLASGDRDAHKFSLDLLSKARIKAETAAVPIRPLTIGSQKAYVVFIHPYQAYQLKSNVATGQWLDIQKAAMQGGEVSNNPIFTGALGMYDGVIIHVDQRVPWGKANDAGVRVDTALGQSNVARAVLCGAQAGMLAFGRDSGWPFRMKWVEDMRDYENQLGVSAAMVWGMKKTAFKAENAASSDATDFATIAISTYTPGI